MKLAEDRQVVEALKQILEGYGYLEYDEIWPDCDELHIKVTALDAKRNGQIPIEIRLKLEDATNRKFSSPHGGPYEDSYDFDDGWDGFFLWENNSKEVRYT